MAEVLNVSSEMFNSNSVEKLTWGYAGDIVVKDKKDHTVYGVVSGPKEDLDMQGCDPTWLKEAIPQWFKRGNIRQMHSAQMPPAGKAKKIVEKDSEWYTAAKIVNEDAWKLVAEGVYTGFSVGIKNPVIVEDPRFKHGLIKGGQIIEVSLVDCPAYKWSELTTDPTRFQILKRAKDGAFITPDAVRIEDVHAESYHDNWLRVENEKKAAGQTIPMAYTRPVTIIPGITSPSEALKAAGITSSDLVNGDIRYATKDTSPAVVAWVLGEAKAAQILGLNAIYQKGADGKSLVKRNFDRGVGGGIDRDKVPDEDFAGPNRSYPIVNEGDISDAMSLLGHADNPEQVKKRIKAIARRKGFAVPGDNKEKSPMAEETKAVKPAEGDKIDTKAANQDDDDSDSDSDSASDSSSDDSSDSSDGIRQKAATADTTKGDVHIHLPEKSGSDSSSGSGSVDSEAAAGAIGDGAVVNDEGSDSSSSDSSSSGSSSSSSDSSSSSSSSSSSDSDGGGKSEEWLMHFAKAIADAKTAGGAGDGADASAKKPAAKKPAAKKSEAKPAGVNPFGKTTEADVKKDLSVTHIGYPELEQVLSSLDPGVASRIRAALGSDTNGPAFEMGNPNSVDGNGGNPTEIHNTSQPVHVTPAKFDLMGPSTPSSAGASGAAAGVTDVKFVTADQVVEIMTKFVESDAFKNAVRPTETKAEAKGTNGAESKTAALDVDKTANPDVAKTISKLASDVEKIKKMAQPAKSVAGENLVVATDRRDEATKAATADGSDFAALMGKAVNGDVEAQKSLRERFEKKGATGAGIGDSRLSDVNPAATYAATVQNR